MLLNFKNEDYDFRFKDEEKSEMAENFGALQRKVNETGLPVLIIIDGWECSGKGYVIHDLVKEVNHKFVKVHVFGEGSACAAGYPYLTKFWKASPGKGDISIFDRSFYCELMDFKESKDVTLAGKVKEYSTVERQLIDNGTLILKFFLNLDEKAQKKRIKEYKDDKYKKALLSDRDYKQNEDYDKYQRRISEILTATNTKAAPWRIIPADSMKDASSEVLGICIEEIEKALDLLEKNGTITLSREILLPEAKDVLGGLDMSKTMSKEEYDERKSELDKALNDLGYEFYLKNVPAMIIFEGVDAAGKGGAIKRLTGALDPRGYDVVPISKPTEVELAHHYLWRFWNVMPQRGKTVIFDRSWYGRVLVERIEGLANEFEWKRAYDEINATEKHLYREGMFVLKFFLSVDKDEQLNRFNSREEDPEKNYKLTDEDWRNRDKWDRYITAYNDMLTITDTEYAPWVVVPGNDKYYARIKVMEETCRRSKEFLDGLKD